MDEVHWVLRASIGRRVLWSFSLMERGVSVVSTLIDDVHWVLEVLLGGRCYGVFQ